MKLHLVDWVAVSKPWKSINGTVIVSDIKQRMVTLSSSFMLDVFSQLANWLILYSSKFGKIGNLCQIGRLNLVKWIENPEWLHASLNVTVQAENYVEFVGRIYTNNHIIAEVEQLKISLTTIEAKEESIAYKQIWANIQTQKITHPPINIPVSFSEEYWSMKFMCEGHDFQFFALPERYPSPTILAIKGQAMIEIDLGDMSGFLPCIVKFANASFEDADISWRFVIRNQRRFLWRWKIITNICFPDQQKK